MSQRFSIEKDVDIQDGLAVIWRPREFSSRRKKQPQRSMFLKTFCPLIFEESSLTSTVFTSNESISSNQNNFKERHMKLPVQATRALGSGRFWVHQNGPTILTIGGLVGFGITTALAIRQTTKAQPVLEKIEKDLTEARQTDVTGTDKQQVLVKAYAKASLQLAEQYWPVLAMGAASTVAIVAGHRTMLKRQASLVAAYSLLDAGFKAYRRKVAEVIGEEEEQKLYREQIIKGMGRNLEACEYIAGEDDVMPSPYAKFFDEMNANWRQNPEYNLFFLRCQQDWATDRLRARGYLFLNEVLEALGMPWMQAGQHVGWKLGQANSDDYVDFGMYEIGDECKRAFINGHEHTILLDFNCVAITI